MVNVILDTDTQLIHGLQNLIGQADLCNLQMYALNQVLIIFVYLIQINIAVNKYNDYREGSNNNLNWDNICEKDSNRLLINHKGRLCVKLYTFEVRAVHNIKSLMYLRCTVIKAT